jgi:hypothetical protein
MYQLQWRVHSVRCGQFLSQLGCFFERNGWRLTAMPEPIAIGLLSLVCVVVVSLRRKIAQV